MSSTGNLTLTGYEPAVVAVRNAGLQGAVQVTYAPHDGILIAQYAAFTAVLTGLSLAALIRAFGVSAFISALVSSLLFARADFLKRVDGRAWAGIMTPRLTVPVPVGSSCPRGDSALSVIDP